MRSEPKMPAAIGQLYEAAEVVLDDSENLSDSLLDASRRQLRLFDDYLLSLHRNTDAVLTKTMALAAHNVDASSRFARKLMRARSPNEVLVLQMEFCQQQFAAFGNQLLDLSQIALKATTEHTSR